MIGFRQPRSFAMTIDRRAFVAGLAAAPLGVGAGSPDDQTPVLQRAIEQAAAARVPLALAPGVYRASDLALPAGAQIPGTRGATPPVASRGRPLFLAPP